MRIKLLKIIYFILIPLVIITLFGCKNSDSDKNMEAIRLFDENEITLQTNHQILSFKKINADTFIASYINPMTRSYELAYSNPTLSKFEPIGKDAAGLINYQNVLQIENPYGKYGTGSRLLYDVDSNGIIYILQSEIIEKNGLPLMDGQKQIFVYDKNGIKLESIPIDGIQLIQNMSSKKLIARYNQFIVISSTGIQIINAEGKTVDEISVSAEKYYNLVSGEEGIFPGGLIDDVDIVDEDHIVLVQTKQSDRHVTLYNIKSKKIEWSQEIEHGFIPRKIHFEQETNEIYVASNHHVLSYSKDGMYNGELINFNEYLSGEFNSSLFFGRDVLDPGYIVFESAHMMYFYMVSTGSEPSIQKVYSYRELIGDDKQQRQRLLEKEQAKKTPIYLSLPFINSGLEEMIAQYERLNPNIRVVVSTFRDSHMEFNIEDYNQYVSLQLLTNKNKWDIISTTYLSYKEYIDKGYFANIENISPKIWEAEQVRFLPNIIEASKVNGQLLLFPTRISFFTVLADPKLAEKLQPNQYKWEDLIPTINKLIEEVPNMKSWYLESPGYRFSSMYDILSDSYKTDLTAPQNNTELQKQLFGQFLDIAMMLSNSNDHIQSPGQQALFIMIPFHISEFLNYANLLESEKKLLPTPASPQSGKHSFVMQEGYAVNKNSKVKEETLKLILFLAEYTQSNNIILQKTYNDLLNQQGMTEQKKQAIQQLQAIIENLDSLRYLDFRLSPSLYETTQQYVEGLIDKETAIRTIQDKLWLYANE